MSSKRSPVRLGAVAASVVAMLGLLSGTGHASGPSPAPDVSAQVTYVCYFDSYWLCAETLVNVYQRARPTSKSDHVDLLSKGRSVQLRCWAEGEVVKGVNVWYYTATDVDYPYQTIGWVTGAYLSTGRDPAWGIGHC